MLKLAALKKANIHVGWPLLCSSLSSVGSRWASTKTYHEKGPGVNHLQKVLFEMRQSKQPKVWTNEDNRSNIDSLGHKEMLTRPLWKFYRKMNNREFGKPLSHLNSVDRAWIDPLIETFVKNLFQELEKATQRVPGEENLKKLSIADYMNPRMDTLVPMMHSIEHGKVPEGLAEIYSCKTKDQFLEHILSLLFYKKFIEMSLNKMKPLETSVDLSNPAEWFPEARKMKRQIIMHVGPTNSGKTFSSLQKLARAKSGYYAGPLRLLAREIYERFMNEGIKCNLITGEEVVPSINEFGKISEISSGTIEMIPTHKKMDICIIDEIQMIADPRRGEAWTNAVLGVQANEVHMCGEESAVPLIQKLAHITGDEIQVRRYNRLGKLNVCDKEIKSLKNLSKGDCVIAFSKRKILELKCEIEKTTNLKVGVIYGALPPEIRSKEANNFNNHSYDILVASDAVGMGLNLRIKRIVFFTTKKFNGKETIPLTVSEVKQIAGRAGRYSKDAGESEGSVTALLRKDVLFLKKMMNEPIKDLTKACIWPTNRIWIYYMSKFPSQTSFFEILENFEEETSQLDMDNFFLTSLDTRYDTLKLFLREDLYKKTTIEDQLKLSLAPINFTVASPLVIKTAFNYFKNVAARRTRNVFEFSFLHAGLLKRRPKLFTTTEETVSVLQALEENHKLILIFLWLSQRWPTLFVDKESAMEVKTLVEKRISEELVNLRRQIKKSRSSSSQLL